jgi:glutamine synthetase
MFDGSSINGWKAINESDMVLMPDTSSAFIDPFFQEDTLVLFCDVLEPSTGEPYNRDPRTTAKKAEKYLAASGVGDTVFFGPEAEFFVFDDVRWTTQQNNTGYMLDSEEGPYNSGKAIEGGNLGHRPGPKGGYFPVPPIDSGQDYRTEMLAVMRELGLEPEKHHHEVAPSQHELGMKFSTLTTMADRMQLYKYIVHQVAAAYGKTATFMPKPVYADNGSGMHVHQSIWKDGKPLFAGDKYADLSEMCLHYIGGIIKHARAINAFANASTNSYKRLVPGYEAPVLLAYSSRNRSASIRIPHVSSPKAKRLEVRFPDAAGNPYLTFAALMMAGLDGIENKIHPGDAMDKDLYDLPPEELKDIPTVSRNLREALENLDADRDFLKKGGVMDDDQIDAYIDLKMEEVSRIEHHPHPVEFDLYYKC